MVRLLFHSQFQLKTTKLITALGLLATTVSALAVDLVPTLISEISTTGNRYGNQIL